MTRNQTRCDLLAIVFVGIVANFSFLNREVSWGSHESRHSLVAAEMMDRHDYFVPRRLGELYPDKPPVMHNAIVLLFRLTGRVSIFVARIPSAIAGIMGALGLYGIAVLLHDRRTALFSALGVLCIPGYVILARMAKPDMFFISSMLVASWLLVWGMKRQERGSRFWLFTAAGLFTGISTLTKGPYGLLIPLFVVVFTPIRRSDLRRPRLSEWLMFAVAFVFLVSLWAVPVYLRDGGVFLKSVILQRDIVTMVGGARRPFYWYLGPTPLFFLPWTLFLPLVLVDMRRRYSPAPYIALAILILLSCVTGKRANYLGPWFPFAMLAVANSITARDERWPWMRRTSRTMLALCIVSMPLYFGWLQPWLEGPVEPERVFAEKVMEIVPQGSAVIGFRGMGEAVSFINYERGHPHIIKVVETRETEILMSLIEKALDSGQPCYFIVMSRDLKDALFTLRNLNLELVFEREVKKREYWRLYRVRHPQNSLPS